MSDVYFAGIKVKRLEQQMTLPAKFQRMLDRLNLAQTVKGRRVCIKMHLGRALGYIGAEHMLYLNQLMNITMVCDCWGFSMASLVPDIGLLASRDIVAIERAALDLINKSRQINLDGLPEGRKLRPGKHLFQKIHGKDPYIMSDIMADMGLGQKKYRLVEIE